jgi:hypothetical protein
MLLLLTDKVVVMVLGKATNYKLDINKEMMF